MNETRNDESGPTSAHDTRDWFAPPPAQPEPPDITYSGALPRRPTPPPVPGRLHRNAPDQQVWPPVAQPQREERSTQPFPAVTDETPPPPPPPSSAQAPPRPAEPARPPQPQLTAVPGGGKRGMRRGTRIALQGAGALLSVAVAVAAPGWFRYEVYLYARPADHIQTAHFGQSANWMHVSWQATMTKISDPGGRPGRPDRQWVKILLTRTALDGEGAIRHGAPEVALKDTTGRSWRAELLNDDTPPETAENKVGTPYKLEFVGVVPPPLADTIEVHVRPSTYRSVPGQSVSDMLKESVDGDEKTDHVLRFTR